MFAVLPFPNAPDMNPTFFIIWLSRCFLFGIVTVGSTGLHAQETSADLPVLDGILSVGKKSYALFRGFDPSGHLWAVVNDPIGDYILDRIGGVSVMLRDRANQRQEVYVQGWQTLERREKSAPARENWINSNENPMLQHPIALPLQVQVRLGDLSPDEKFALHTWYLSYGWRMSFVIDSAGYWDIGFENVYGEQRRNRLALDVARFRAMLSPKAALMYDEFTRPLDYDTYKATENERRERLRAFTALLSPDQQRAFEQLQISEASFTATP